MESPEMKVELEGVLTDSIFTFTPGLQSSELPTDEPPKVKEEEESKSVHIANALQLIWSFGMNKNVPVLNLSDGFRKGVFYTTAHAGVFFDCHRNAQMLFQGHCNSISCTCVSEDKRWLCTADIGQGSMVIVWDSNTGIPLQTLFEAHPEGTQCMALSHDAKYLVTLSYSVPQVVSLWDWTAESDDPLCSMTLEECHGLQTHVAFSSEDPRQFLSNNGAQVIFYYRKDDELVCSAPSLTDKDFNKAVGLYSQSLFQPGSSRALTATKCGNIVVWVHSGGELPCNRKALKIVKIQDKALTVLTLCASYVATGDIEGYVRFFDKELRLSNWYQQFEEAGPINAISFSYMPKGKETERMVQKKKFPSSSTLEAPSFIVNDFVVGTSKANILYFKTAGSFAEFIRNENDKDVQAIACHPSESRICIGGQSGLLQLWNFGTRVLLQTRQFQKDEEITCAAFNDTGSALALGFSNGCVRVVDGLILEDEGYEETPSVFYHCHDNITHVTFSPNSKYMATADLDRCVTLFKYQPNNKKEPWIYIGKQRAHYKAIVDIAFGQALDEDRPRLLSVGKDRVLVEYDLVNSTVDDFKLISSNRIEQSAVPTCFSWYPPIVKEDFLVIANDQYKLKLFNSTTQMCRKTLLGPTYGSPIQKIAMLPSTSYKDSGYMAYITEDKVGLHILPLDGNPHKSMALIAHPGKVYSLACSHDGAKIFTAGGPDSSVLMWEINFSALHATAELGGTGMVPFYGLLEGGRDGDLFAELEDYFYYAQMKSQGVDSTEIRQITTKIPITEIPFIMRAMGYYPTEQEIDDMLNEMKFSNYVETGKNVSEIDLGDFIQLYVNHRPAFGLSPDDIEDAFQKLGMPDEHGEFAVERSRLFYLLQNKGEHLTEAELAEYTSTLLGLAEPSGTTESHTFDATESAQLLEQNLPPNVTSPIFASGILGFTE